jgi:pimeloyl-ACP methyl ester carboxylesterase
MPTGTISANNIDFTYIEEGTGPLALCLHGFPDSAHTYRHLLPALAEAGYRAVAPFMRGYHPTGPAPDGAYQSGVLGIDANRLHEALGGDGDAVLIGHDWGALASYAASNTEAERWRRVVTMAVPPAGQLAEAFFTYEQLRLSWYMFFFQHPLADMVVPLNGFDYVSKLWRDWSPGYDGAEDFANFVSCVPSPEHVSAVIDYYRHTIGGVDNRGENDDAQAATFAGPPQPTLYLHGRDDGCMDARLAEGAENFLPGAGSMSEIIEDVGHFLHLEQADAVNSKIIDFIA